MAVDQDAIDMFQPQLDGLISRLSTLQASHDALTTRVADLEANGGGSALNLSVEAFLAEFWGEYHALPDNQAKINYLDKLRAAA